jgi:hypothetical protein
MSNLFKQKNKKKLLILVDLSITKLKRSSLVDFGITNTFFLFMVLQFCSK